MQPIIIYPGTSDEYPAARYLLLVGQRRWTAAHLVGLDTLDAIVVDPPSAVDRVRIQYAENEDREEFSDMERAWALQQMKQALDDAPWEVVETRLQMSRTRRHQLIRMLTFSATQQVEVARLRLQETQIRPLHTALRNQELDSNQVDSVLKRLSEIALERATEKLSGTSDEAAADTATLRRSGIDGPTVARLVARARRAATPMPQTPRWLPLLEEQIARTQQAFQRSIDRVEALGAADAQRLQEAARQLREDIDRIVAVLERHKQGREEA